MFWITLGLAGCLFWVALEGYWQAQGALARSETMETRMTLNFNWLKAQNPRHTKNVCPTVSVDYRRAVGDVASAAGADWSDDGLKTQCLSEQDSGFRLKQR